jgi:hypothetical protein
VAAALCRWLVGPDDFDQIVQRQLREMCGWCLVCAAEQQAVVGVQIPIGHRVDALQIAMYWLQIDV